ncbi:hypothetical protein L3X38_013251 [Prunus dulcis]|uniref:D-isomer specific 2-hydroxyacid dehydrogenase family protein n=1 Tax=Prunus dulcis TaxID=3755 RepID=A0AAD4WL59_PRUDU|nr:hypothetical protein L3X38_013251 [Prunus dulcis]
MAQFQSQDLPQLQIIHPPAFFTHFQSELSKKFHILHAGESPLPLDQYLTTYAGSVQAMLCYHATQVNEDLLRLLPALKLVLTCTSGVNHIDVVECRRRGIAIATARSVYSEDVADIGVGLFLDVQRKISAVDRPNPPHDKQGSLICNGKRGVIVNVGRRAIVDVKELVMFLVHGEIGGAGLDVFENEPHVPKELVASDNVALSPHKAVHTTESFQSSNEFMLANLGAFFSNKPYSTH